MKLKFNAWRLQVLLATKRPDWNQSEFGRQLGANSAQVTGWLNGENQPEPDRIRQMARLLGCNELTDLRASEDDVAEGLAERQAWIGAGRPTMELWLEVRAAP